MSDAVQPKLLPHKAPQSHPVQFTSTSNKGPNCLRASGNSPLPSLIAIAHLVEDVCNTKYLLRMRLPRGHQVRDVRQSNDRDGSHNTDRSSNIQNPPVRQLLCERLGGTGPENARGERKKGSTTRKQQDGRELICVNLAQTLSWSPTQKVRMRELQNSQGF